MSDFKTEKMYNLRKTSEILGVSVQTLRSWDFTGKLKAYRTKGNHRRYSESQLKDYLEKSKKC